MKAAALYLLKTTNKRVITLLLAIGLVAGSFPIASLNASAVTTHQSHYIDGAGGTQGIDVYTSGGQSKPGIIFVHGGGWRTGDKSFYNGLATNAAERGYVGISINYRLGASGVYYQYEDVMRAVQEVRSNAGAYGVDPNRLAIWGDSAGGSLAMRIAASGESGLAAAVGWSAPLNSYTGIFNSLQSFAIGMDHATCVPTDPDGIARIMHTMPASAGGNGNGTAAPLTQESMFDLLGVNGATQASNAGIPAGTTGIGSNAAPVNLANLDATQVLATLSQLAQQAQGAQQPGQPASAASSDGQVLRQVFSAVAQAAGTSADPNLQAVSGVANQLAATAGNNGSTPSIYDPSSPTASAKVKATAAQAPLVATASHAADGTPIPHELQRVVLGIMDALGCQDNFRALSPAKHFAPNTPPTFLANAQSEFLVHPGQAIEYSNNLRAAGIPSEFLILPGDIHMGYDERAVQPSFDFLARHL